MDRYRKLFWLLCGALIVFTAGAIVGTGLTINSIKHDCVYLTKFRIGKAVYDCRSDFSFLSNKPKESKK